MLILFAQHINFTLTYKPIENVFDYFTFKKLLENIEVIDAVGEDEGSRASLYH